MTTSMIRNCLTAFASIAALAACGGAEESASTSSAPETIVAEAQEAVDAVEAPSAEQLLDAALAAQDDEAKARYDARRPKETLQFFGIEPGMTVVDTLPGGGWYTKILLPYLGEEGTVVGADYAIDMWKLFGGFANEEFLTAKETWVETWTADAEAWRGEGDASLAAFQFGALPDDMKGTADAVLLIRAMHHFNRFEDEGGFLTSGLADMFAVLKPGGIVGVVQHRAPEGNSDEWAVGNAGYVKQSQQIAAFEAAGFELVATSEINANSKDTPNEDEVVWRLPPSLGTSGDDEELRAQMIEIGESDRMTLKFRKPE